MLPALKFLNWEKKHMSFTIYCTEDDVIYGKLIRHKLSMDPEYSVKIFQSGSDLLKGLSDQPDVITLDINLPDMKGDELLKKVKSKSPETIIIVLSGQEDVSTAVELFKLGIFDYIEKNDNALDRLWQVVHNATKQRELNKELVVLREEVDDKYHISSDIKGVSKEMQQVFTLIEKTVKSNINVIVNGETGTGKELVAKSIHFNSTRKSKPFIPINVTAIPRELIESELFGHEKGSFTGAHEARVGLFEMAKGGTVFLDEIGEMDLAMQVKLLRVLQEMEMTRVGGNKKIQLEFRLIVATHRNLLQEVKAGRFREDLYYRLMGITIELPPLRNRGKDIVILANYFLKQFCKKNRLPEKSFDNSAIKTLLSYSFPGNVRELKAVVESAIVLSDGSVIKQEDLSLAYEDNPEQLLNSEMSLEDYTNQIIQLSLKRNNNNVVKTAEKLGIGKSTIYRLIKEGKITTL